MKPVLICGGVGTKMWPESRPEKPKHFLPLIDGKSLFRLNYETLLKKFKPEEIFVQTTEAQKGLVKIEAAEIPEKNIFLEPEVRNQGPATGLAAANLYKIDPDGIFMLIQVDVLRVPESELFKMMDRCEELVKKEGKLITGGYRPPFAMMGCDYLIRGDRVEGTGEVMVWRMEKWLGRDEKESVEGFLKDGKALLHSNHYCWTPRLMLESIKKYKPEWYEPLMRYINGADLAVEYANMPKGPFEEVTKFELSNGLVVEHAFEWIDFGTWESVDMYLKRTDQYQNPTKLVNIESSGNFVRMSDPNKPVALIGVNDLVVVDTPQGLLICKKDQSGRVGEVVKGLEGL